MSEVLLNGLLSALTARVRAGTEPGYVRIRVTRAGELDIAVAKEPKSAVQYDKQEHTKLRSFGARETKPKRRSKGGKAAREFRDQWQPVYRRLQRSKQLRTFTAYGGE